MAREIYAENATTALTYEEILKKYKEHPAYEQNLSAFNLGDRRKRFAAEDAVYKAADYAFAQRFVSRASCCVYLLFCFLLFYLFFLYAPFSTKCMSR